MAPLSDNIMRELSEVEVNKLEWSDANYYGYYWLSGVVDPTFAIRVEPCNSELLELVAVWACNLKVELDYINRVGPLLTRDVKIQKKDNNWEIYVDLAHRGHISFECNKLFLRST